MLIARKLLREHERERQAWEKERAQLIATVCHLARRPLPDPRPEMVVHNGNGAESIFDGSYDL
jgi:hypothetical protein